MQHVPPRLRLGQALLALDELEHGLVQAQLHENVDVVLVFKNVLEFHYMFMAKLSMDLYLRLKLRNHVERTRNREAQVRMTEKRF